MSIRRGTCRRMADVFRMSPPRILLRVNLLDSGSSSSIAFPWMTSLSEGPSSAALLASSSRFISSRSALSAASMAACRFFSIYFVSDHFLSAILSLALLLRGFNSCSSASGRMTLLFISM